MFSKAPSEGWPFAWHLKFCLLIFESLIQLPGHSKNDVWPEAGSEDLFKKYDHTFQTFSKPWSLHGNRFTRGLTYLFVANTCPLKSMTKALTCLISSFSLSTNCSTVSRSASTSSPNPVWNLSVKERLCFRHCNALILALGECIENFQYAYSHLFKWFTLAEKLSQSKGFKNGWLRFLQFIVEQNVRGKEIQELCRKIDFLHLVVIYCLECRLSSQVSRYHRPSWVYQYIRFYYECDPIQTFPAWRMCFWS